MTANETAARLRGEFLERHRDAHWLVFDSRTHQAVGAIYYSYDWFDTPEMQERDLRNFFREVQAADLEWLKGSAWEELGR